MITQQFEIHEAIVTRIEDDDYQDSFGGLRGAIYFQADTLLEDQEYPIPAQPNFNFVSAALKSSNGNENTGSAGFFWVPEPGDFIEVVIDTSISHPRPYYKAMFYNNVNDLDRNFKTNYGKRLGWKTKCGHIFIFDDTKNSENILFEHTFGGQLNFDTNGNISILSRKVTKRDKKLPSKDTVDDQYHKIRFDFEQKKIFIEDNENNIITIHPDGITIKDKSENIIDMKPSGIDITVKGEENVKIDTSANIDIGSATNVNIGSEATINVSNDCNITVGGLCELIASQINLNGSSSGITTANSHAGVIDLITGAPVTPSTTVFSDV